MSDIKSKYKIISRKEDETASILIIGGYYDDVIYEYGAVSLPDKENEDGTMPLKFEYNIIENVGIEKENFDKEFFNLIGDILVDIINSKGNK
jgi:hypothetical protein|tara:strand:+ start:1755 stop:2030 length:276 start_codon:yes stop_codon:yes gene_type:complete